MSWNSLKPARCFLLAALALPLAAGLASAQDSATKPSADPRVNHAAESLHARALALFDKPRSSAAAAALLVRAARLRTDDDATAVNELVTAAKLYYYARRVSVARTTMQVAAERALSFGDVVTAAHSYIDAAFLAAQQRDGAGVNAMLLKARLLARAPQMAIEDRNAIMGRITPILLAGQ